MTVAAACTAMGWAADVIVFGPQTYTRGPGRPVKARHTFTVTKPSGRYVMRIANCGVTNAVVMLNGKVIFDPDDFTHERRAGRNDERERGREGDDNDRDRRDRERDDNEQDRPR